MTDQQDRGAIARAIIDSNLYMTLGTADEAGRPWVSPVYYAVAGYSEFFWVSEPETTHSRNLARRPQLSIVIFDSTVPIDTGQGVYMSAIAGRVEDPDLDRGLRIFSHRSQEHGGRPWTREDVQPPADVRLYRAIVSEYSMQGPKLPRTPVDVLAYGGAGGGGSADTSHAPTP